MLEIRNLKLFYKTSSGIVRAVDNVSFELKNGEALGVVGESGSGKTSLALAIMRLLPPNTYIYEGRVLLDGQDLMLKSEESFRKEVRWKGISLVFQGAMNSLNPVMRVGRLIAERPLLEANVSREEVYSSVKNILREVGLEEDVFYKYPHELSGGMKQRVVIAMALIMNPKVVILDEPTSALDVRVQAQIMNLLKQLKKERGISMIFITHDLALSSDIADKYAVLYGGEVIESGLAEEVLRRPKHPYTKLLLDSLPRISEDLEPKFIKGSPPDLRNPPSGCRFHPRCPEAFSACRTRAPLNFKIEENQYAKCWLYGDG